RDLSAAVFRVEDLVAIADVERATAAVLVDRAIADGDDPALLRLLFGRVGEDDSASGRLLLLDRLHDQPVPEGLQLHPYTSVCAVRSVLTGLGTLSMRVPTSYEEKDSDSPASAGSRAQPPASSLQPSSRAIPSPPRAITQSWFHSKTGRAIGARRFIQALVVETF